MLFLRVLLFAAALCHALGAAVQADLSKSATHLVMHVGAARRSEAAQLAEQIARRVGGRDDDVSVWPPPELVGADTISLVLSKCILFSYMGNTLPIISSGAHVNFQ